MSAVAARRPLGKRERAWRRRSTAAPAAPAIRTTASDTASGTLRKPSSVSPSAETTAPIGSTNSHRCGRIERGSSSRAGA